MKFNKEISSVGQAINELEQKLLKEALNQTEREILTSHVRVLSSIKIALVDQQGLYTRAKKELDEILTAAKSRDAVLSKT